MGTKILDSASYCQEVSEQRDKEQTKGSACYNKTNVTAEILQQILKVLFKKDPVVYSWSSLPH